MNGSVLQHRCCYLFLIICLLITSFLHSQSPLGIPYQAMIRGNDGSPLLNAPVSVRFTLHQNAFNGAVEYQETQSLTTNNFGLINTVFGNGIVVQGTFSGIVWSNTTKFIQIEADYGSGYIEMGTQQLMSVPYALHSSSSSYAVNAQSASNGFSSVSLTGDTLYLANGNFIIVPGISAANSNNGGGGNNTTSGLGSIVLPGNTTCANEFISVIGCAGQTSLTYDGRTYDLVEIGGQCWFADNLATDQYRNGDAIPTGLDNAAWESTTSGAYAVYNNDPANDAIYGKLYNWYTTADSRGLCPTGWHVPSDCEWMYLEGTLGMPVALQESTNFRGSDEGGKLKSVSEWNSPNVGATNVSGFNAQAGGYHNNWGGFDYIGTYGHWWTTTIINSESAWTRVLANSSATIARNFGSMIMRNGYSIRCLKDLESAPIQGCTDGSACNFLANATQDDGSCLYPNATCDDGDVNTVNDVINGECVCAGVALGNAAQLLPGNTTCQFQNISVTGCGGQTSLTYDGRTYDLVEIGGQCWFADNLATDQYSNGDPIATGLDFTEWQNTTQGSYSFYDNNLGLEALYGKLYNWYAVNDNRGLCPIGWHVPTDCEWMYLESNLGMGNDLLELEGWRGTNQGGALKSTSNWQLPNTGATNSSGFTALPGGFRSIDQYSNGGNFAIFWAQNNFNELNSFFRALYFVNADIYRGYQENWFGHSVRCLRD